jgi:hypothetical protein
MNMTNRPKQARLPKYGKVFAQPIRLSPLGKKQVGVTPAIEKYVLGFKEKGFRGLDLAKAIVNDIAGFKEAKLPNRTAERLWARRSADDAIKTRRVYLMADDEGAVKNGKGAIMACVDYSIATVAALRSAGINAVFVRAGIHSYVKFFLKGKVYIADAHQIPAERVKAMNAEEKRREDSFRRQNAFAEGASPASIGLSSYKDFFKYRFDFPRTMR